MFKNKSMILILALTAYSSVAFADPLIGDINNTTNTASQNSTILANDLRNSQSVNGNSYTYNPTNTSVNTNANNNQSSANGNLNQQSNFGNSSNTNSNIGNSSVNNSGNFNGTVTGGQGGNAQVGPITNTNTAAGGSVVGSGNSTATGGTVTGSGNSNVDVTNTVRDSGNSTNLINAGNGNGNLSNVGNSEQSQGQGQDQSQSQNTVAGNGNGNNNGNVSINVAAPKTYRPPVSSAIAPTVFPTAPCMGSTSAAATGTLIALSGGSSWESKECMIFEAARNFEQSGARVDAMHVRCQSKYAAVAPSCKALKRGDELVIEDGELKFVEGTAQQVEITKQQIVQQVGTGQGFLGLN